MFDSFLGNEETNDRQRKTFHVKTVIIGGKNVGKTTISNALNNFEGFENYSIFGGSGCSHVPEFKSTFVADVFKRNLPASIVFDTVAPNRRPTIGNSSISSKDDVEIVLWDTAGYERHEKFPPALLLNGADVVLLCFAVNDVTSLHMIEDLIEHCKKSKVSDHCVYFVIGNKLDVYRQLCGKMITSSSIAERKRNGRKEKGSFVFGDKYNVVSGLDEFVDESFYEEAEKQFIESARPCLIKLQRVLLNVNNAEPLDNVNSSSLKPKKKQLDLLFSYTTAFCDSKSIHNPLYCVLYAVAVHLERKIGYSDFNATLTDGTDFCKQNGSRNVSSISSTDATRSGNGANSGTIRLGNEFGEPIPTETTRITNAFKNDNKEDGCCT